MHRIGNRAAALRPASDRQPEYRKMFGDRAAGMTDAIILLRTNTSNPAQHEWVEELRWATGLPVWLAADEAAHPVEIGSATGKIPLGRDGFDALGLLTDADTMWRCGDYALYAAASVLPDAALFWLVEPDVRIHLADPGEFFRFFARHSDVDFLACRLWETNAGWSWYATMRPYAERVMSCLFPITRFSRRSLAFLLSRRQRLTSFHRARLAAGERPDWPNDEVFCATELCNADYRCKDFNSFGPVFHTDATFSFLDAMALSRLRRMPHDGLIYHPVVAGEQFERKLRQRLYHDVEASMPRPRLLARYGPEVLADLAAECGEEAAHRFAQDLAGTARRAPAAMPPG